MKRRWWIVGYLVALAMVLLSPFASSSPDGLERVAEDKGFLDRAGDAPYSVIADYVAPGIHNEALATIIAGFIGVTILFLVVAGGSWLALRYARSRDHIRPSGGR